MKKIQLNGIRMPVSLAVFACLAVTAQRVEAVGGISGSKLITPCTDTVPRGKAEVEPYFSIGTSVQGFDSDYRRYDLGLRHQVVETGFRYTIGLSSSVEIGLITPFLFAETRISDTSDPSRAGLGDILLGLKWRVWEAEQAALALQTGVVLPSGYSNPDEEQQALALGEGVIRPEVGLVATFLPVDAFSIDVSVQGGVSIPTLDGSENGWIAGLDLALGYAFGPFQPVLEINQAIGGWPGIEEYLLSANLGFTYDVNDVVIIVTGAGIDLIGKNVDQGWSYNLALTLLF